MVCLRLQTRALSGQANINNELVYRLKRQLFESLDTMPPAEVWPILKVLDYLMTVPSSGADGNRNVLNEPPSSNVEIISSEKVMAAGTSLSPDTQGCQVPDMNYVRRLESKLENQDSRIQNLESKVVQHDSLFSENHCFRQCLADEVTRQRKAVVQLEADFNKLKINHDILQQNFIQAHAKITRLQEIIGQVNQEIAALHRKTEINKQRIDVLARRLDDMNEKVSAYVSLVAGVDIQSVA